MIYAIPDGAVELYFDNSKKLETYTSGITVQGHIKANQDDSQLILGTGNDLKLWHDGSDSYVQAENVGSLYLKCTTNNEHVVAWAHVNGDFRAYVNNGEPAIIAGANGSVDLYYDNTLHFQTKSDGVAVVGDHILRLEQWQGALDRGWDDYPSITITPSTTYGSNQNEFRLHGVGGAALGYGSGSDFSIDLRVDGGYSTGSDRRRKTNIEEITGALSTVKQLTGKKFNIINREGELDPNKGTKKQFGLIAQECEDIIPEVITFHPNENTPNENGWCSAYGLDYGQLTPLLINAIKELSAEVDTLKTKVAALEGA